MKLCPVVSKTLCIVYTQVAFFLCRQGDGIIAITNLYNIVEFIIVDFALNAPTDNTLKDDEPYLLKACVLSAGNFKN